MSVDIERTGTTPRMSKMVKHGGTVYLCGQTAFGAAMPGIEAQTREALSRVDALLAAAGTDMEQRVGKISSVMRAHQETGSALPSS